MTLRRLALSRLRRSLVAVCDRVLELSAAVLLMLAGYLLITTMLRLP